MTYVSQIITLYPLNLYRAVGQLYFNKTGRKQRSISVALKVDVPDHWEPLRSAMCTAVICRSFRNASQVGICSTLYYTLLEEGF